jgi:HK97 family phage portal protein
MEFKLFSPSTWVQKNEQVTTYNSRITSNTYTFMGADGNAYVKDGYQFNPHVYAVIRLILREVVKADFVLYELEDTNTKRKLKNTPHKVKAKDKMEVGEHDLLNLLYNPNSFQGKSQFLENVIGYKLITGKSFIHQLYPDMGVNAGIPIELFSLASPLVSVKHNQYGEPVKYIVKVGTDTTDIPAEEVVAFNYFNPLTTDNTGQSPLMAARTSVTQSNDGYKANAKMLQNGGASGILTYLSTNPANSFDTKKQQQLEDKYYNRYGGVNNYGKIMVTNAQMKWEQIGLPATDLELIEAQKMTMRDICNVYGVSSQLLNDTENSTYNNVKEARKELISNIVLAELNDYVSEINRVLVPKYEARDNKKYLLAVDKSVYPELKEDEVSLYTMLSTSNFLTTDEKRSRAGLEEIGTPEASEVLIPNSLTPLNMTDEQLLGAAFNQTTNNNNNG